MAAQTEAACLIESGALYTSRIGFRTPFDPVFVGIKHGAFSVYFGDGPFFHFDLEGRWQRLLIDGVHYLKGLDTVVRSIDRVREGENLILKRRVLTYAEVVDLDEVVREMALGLIEKIADGSYPRIEPPEKQGVRALSQDEARDLLEKVATWDANAWFAHKERYLATYAPLPFTPPECMNPFAVQATVGDARAVGFGGLTTGELVVRTPDEFAKHLKGVARLMGERVSQMRQVYLCGGDALRQSPESVRAYLDAIQAVFPIPTTVHRGKSADGNLNERSIQVDGVYAFLADFDGVALSASDWQDCRARGLKSVTLGIETANRELRTHFGRSWQEADLRSTIENLHAGGIRVNLAVVVDAGDPADRAATAALVASLPLIKGEIVSLIKLGDLTGAPTVPDQPDPRETMKTALAGCKAAGIKVVPYLPEKQWI